MYRFSVLHLPTLDGKDLRIEYKDPLIDLMPLPRDPKSIVLSYCQPHVMRETEQFSIKHYKITYHDDQTIHIHVINGETHFPRIVVLNTQIIVDWGMPTNEGVVMAFNNIISRFPRCLQDWTLSFLDADTMRLESEFLEFEINFTQKTLKRLS